MNKVRLEGFSDGVFAIIITIHGFGSESAIRDLSPSASVHAAVVPQLCAELRLRRPLLEQSSPSAACLRTCFRRNSVGQSASAVLASLAPFATRWVGENYEAPWPIALYGVILLFAGLAYFILTKALVAHHGVSSRLATSIGSDPKGLASVLIYLVAIPLAFIWRKAAYGCYIFVAVMWLLPDRRIEKPVR
jgi:hypothetical protein